MRVTIVIPAAQIASVNKWMKDNIDKIGGDKTFHIGLSATGSAPATHYWTCFGAISTDILGNIKGNLGFSKDSDLITKLAAKVGGNAYEDTSNEEVLVKEKLKIIQSGKE